LKERLVNRGGLDAEALNKRLSEAEIEIKQARNFDYVLTSSTPDDDFRQIEALYYKTKIHYIKKYQLNLLNR
jgi:guanylate kinase